MNEQIKLDRRRKYYMILDCETATLPKATEYESERAKKTIAIAKPLIYDLGWTIIDNKGNIYMKKNYLIAEIFSVPSIFNTAYYKDKRGLYIDKLQKGEIQLTDWNTANNELIKDLQLVEAVGAYNSMFDYKKAIPFTDLYINQLYAPDFHEWLDEQHRICDWLVEGGKSKSEEARDFEKEVFRYKGKIYPLFDVWGLACRYLLDDEYKRMCIENSWASASGKYFTTNAEKVFRFLSGDMEFEESHTAIDDCLIESEIFARVVKKTKNKWDMGIIYFPFKELGTVGEYCAVMGCENPFADY